MSSYHDIGALSVRLNLQTNDFNKKISSINKQIRSLETDFKSASKGVKNFENSFQGVNAKIKTLTQQIALSNAKLKEQENRYKEFNNSLKANQRTLESYGRVLGKESAEYRKQAQLVAQLAEKTRAVGTAINKTKGDIRAYSSALEENQAKMRAMGSTTQTFAEKLAVIQSEAKLTASSFDLMSTKFKDGSFGQANVQMQKLASEIESTKKQINLYTSELSKMESAQKKAEKEQKQLIAEIKEVGTAIGKAKLNYKENSEEVEKLNDRLMSLKTRLASNREGHTSNAQAIRSHRTELNALNTTLATMSTQLHNIPIDTVSGKFVNAGRTLATTGSILSTTVGLPITMVGKNAVTTAMDFEESMSKVSAISGATGSDLQALESQARELGRTTHFSATESSQAMQYLSMAGLDVNEVMTAMDSQLALAKAGMLELGTTADITTNIMSGFNMTANDLGHIGDVLAYASSNANTNIEQMGEAMVYLAPVGQTLGLSLEDVSSAVMAVSDAGIQGARAGAAFSTSLVRLTKPTEQMEILMKELGITFAETDGTMKPISKIVEELNSAMSDYTDTQKASAINTLFGAEATKHWSALLTVGNEKLEQNAEALRNCDGTAQQMADTMGKNLSGSIKEMKSKLEDFMITVGNALAPTVEKVAEKIGDLTEWFQNLSPSAQDNVIKMGMLAVAIPLVTTALGFLTMGIGKTIKGFDLIGGGIKSLIKNIGKTGTATTTAGSVMTKAIPLLTNPWTLLAGAVAVGGTAIWQLNKKAKADFKEISDNARNSITGVGEYMEELPKKLESASEKIKEVEFFDDGTKASLIKQMDTLKEAMASGKKDVNREVRQLVQNVNSHLDEVPPEMRQSMAQGLAEMLSALASEGKITEKNFKDYIDALNEHAQVKVEIDFDDISKKRKSTLIFNDFVTDMEKVGSKIHTTGNDINQTIDATVKALSEAKDEDLETFRLLSEGIATHVSGLKMSKDEQVAILQQMSHAMAENFDPEQASAMLTALSNAMSLGYEDLTMIYYSFVEGYKQQTGSLQTDTARAYADFINETGSFVDLCAGKFGSLSMANTQFWLDFISRISGSQAEVVANANSLVKGFVAEMKATDDPTIKSTLAKTLAEFVAQLVSTGKITQDEANQIAQGVNEALGGIEGEVQTTIEANITGFSKKEKEILRAMGLIDKETAETEVTTDITKAKKKLDEAKEEHRKTVKAFKDNVPNIDADNSSAMTSISEVKKATIPTKYFTIKAQLENTTGVSLSGTKKQVGPIKRSIDFEDSTLSTISTYADSMDESYNNVRATLSNLDFSSSAYQRSSSNSTETILTVQNNNDATMISLLQTMVENMEKMNQRQNTLEAQLYIDGRQLKSHMEVLDKRANRLSGR